MNQPGDACEYIETREQVQTYLDRMCYALTHGAQLRVQFDRRADKARDPRYTNRYTLANLFPDEDPVVALRRELQTLRVSDYIQTVRDLRFPEKSEMRVFGKVYEIRREVYIKIRVELLQPGVGSAMVFVMSFHDSTIAFHGVSFPYRDA